MIYTQFLYVMWQFLAIYTINRLITTPKAIRKKSNQKEQWAKPHENTNNTHFEFSL